MVKAAWEGAEDADRLLLVIDAAAKHRPARRAVLAGDREQRPEPKILVLNKVDIAKKGDLLLKLATELSARLKPEQVFMVSATSGDGVADLKRRWPRRCRKGRGTSPKTSSATRPTGWWRPS
jgi:GTP-binding protein Era